jgi:hypothetical protein
VEPENEPQLPGLPQLNVKLAPLDAMELPSATVKLPVPPAGKVSVIGVMLIREGRSVRVALTLTVESL